MDLTVAIRAEHHALLKLSDDLLPTSWDSVLADAEPLVLCVYVMEVEQRGWSAPLATEATTTHVVDSADLRSATVLHHGATFAVHILRGVTKPMTVRAEHVALLSLDEERLPWAAERADPEPLGGRIAVMEIERRHWTRIWADGALTSTYRDELRLQLTPTPFQIPIRLLAATFPPMRDQLVSGEIARWSSGRVVYSEGRAIEAEPSPIERSDLAVDHLFGRKRSSASLATQLL